MNMNSRGSVTPVRNTASTVERNMDLYCFLLSASTLRYIARAIPVRRPVAPIICPTLNRAGGYGGEKIGVRFHIARILKVNQIIGPGQPQRILAKYLASRIDACLDHIGASKEV